MPLRNLLSYHDPSALSFRASDFAPEVSLKLALVDGLCDMGMGHTAELLAREYNISRAQQDEFAAWSHEKAISGNSNLLEEIAPFHSTTNNCIRSHSGKVIYDDNGPRKDSTVDKLSKLRTVFDRNGTVTAGNASQVTDGGAALLVMTKKGLMETGATPIAQVVDYAYAGCDPRRMGLGPVKAVEKLKKDIAFNINNMDIVEINEAFAAQVIACQSHLKVPEQNLNVNGGAIALGHPLAASGSRLALTAAKELKRRDKRNALVTACVGGGQGGALWIQNV